MVRKDSCNLFQLNLGLRLCCCMIRNIKILCLSHLDTKLQLQDEGERETVIQVIVSQTFLIDK
uniref:Choline/ethanolaminephosphotransferase 2-like isoform X1 n=1 Tax=Rhizophora mucronata TaxID=61149 RepID=A0A2P2LVH7_RHIMU